MSILTVVVVDVVDVVGEELLKTSSMLSGGGIGRIGLLLHTQSVSEK